MALNIISALEADADAKANLIKAWEGQIETAISDAVRGGLLTATVELVGYLWSDFQTTVDTLKGELDTQGYAVRYRITTAGAALTLELNWTQ